MCFFNRNKVREFEGEICLNGDRRDVVSFSRAYMDSIPPQWLISKDVYEDTDDVLRFRLVLGTNNKPMCDYELTMKYIPLEGCGTKITVHAVGTGIVYKSSKQFFRDYIKKFGEIKQEQAQ